jgi:hypothetical protein
LLKAGSRFNWKFPPLPDNFAIDQDSFRALGKGDGILVELVIGG